MNLFIGNLSPETSEDTLRQIFSEFGTVLTVKIPIDNTTGLPRGFGFVEMEDKFHAYDAIDNLDTTYLLGNIISVKESKPKTQGGGGFNRNNNRQGGGFNRNNNNRQGGNYNRGGGGGGYSNNRSNYSSDRGSYNSERGERNYNSDRSYNNNQGSSYNSSNNDDDKFNRL